MVTWPVKAEAPWLSSGRDDRWIGCIRSWFSMRYGSRFARADAMMLFTIVRGDRSTRARTHQIVGRTMLALVASFNVSQGGAAPPQPASVASAFIHPVQRDFKIERRRVCRRSPTLLVNTRSLLKGSGP